MRSVPDDVLSLRGIRKAYNPGTPLETEVLHGIDMDVKKGEFCAVMGPSGSGKSTLLNIIGLLDRPTGGSLTIDGHDTGMLDENGLTSLRGRSIGFVFQYHHLISAFSAVENVMMPLLLRRGFADADMRRTAERLLEQVGLLDCADRKATHMSGGQQQRVAIARALAGNPAIVLADEPTGNLDTRSAEGVFDLMRSIGRTKGTTFLLVTHNLDLARRCDRTIQIVDGHVVA
ncbi:ABC transporter ATP-binding protein [Aureimonas sp. Leaf324]|jgi:lipoprotein-releasing system ATP-binding protein|uniref:ABC transporter ATP-binding protein n=1 Tax=Aureimonas sp. Leaf324 TaxID=1736336 RepID=UPI0006F642BE|nr:ABC transporter ATP-binding protein [Aureimonas sp. Leaf324]KQQ85705.1 ABC transporter ATP-binding protein [Aureimonas sp. Leaf324]